MSLSLSRKQQLWAIGLLIVGSFYLAPHAVYAFNPAKCEIDDRFGAKETRILKKACALAVERLQDEQLRSEVYEMARYSRLSNTVIQRSNVRNTSRDRWYLLQRQLLTLSLPNGENDTEPAFPNIFIAYAHDEPSSDRGWLGRAPLDRVTIHWDGKEWMQKGSFYITINDYFVARGERYCDPNNWAGTIAHEMLHNLGHTHPHSSDPDWDKYQINVVDEMVQNFGVGYKGASSTLFSRHDCQSQER